MARIAGSRAGVGQLGAAQSQTAVAEYNFATLGGAVGSIALAGDKIPAGAVIIDTLLIVDTVPTSGGAALLAVTAESAGDVAAAALISGTPWSTATAKRGTLTATSTPVRTTVERTLTAVVTVAALTAGRFRVLVTYIEPAA